MNPIGFWKHEFSEYGVASLKRPPKYPEMRVFALVNDIVWEDSSLPYNEGAMCVARRIYWQETIGM